MDGKANRIMVVAANRNDRNRIRQLLGAEYALSISTNIVSGLDLARRLPDIDLMLVVGPLNEMTESELLGAIQQSPAILPLPVIFVAEAASPAEVAAALQLGAADYIAGACTDEVLLARIRSRLAAKALIESLETCIAELTETEELHMRLFRMASHDLKSPLNNIRIAEGILRLAATDSGEVANALDTIGLMVDNMSDIISNFLDMMEVRTGKLELTIKPVNLRDVQTNVVNQYRFAAKKKNIRLELGATNGWVLADPQRLVQALANLVSNAIKFSLNDSKVTISSARQKGCGVIIVADEGPGIPSFERDNLFKEYGRLSTRPTGGESSSGLGLWIVKQLMYAQNGSVGAEFPENGGSRFWISLPECSPDTYHAVDNVRAERAGLFPANKEEAISARARGSSDDSAGDG